MDTALRAIEIMNPNDKDVANLKEKREGALVAVSTLNEHDLSLNLMEPLWEKDLISNKVAVHIIDQALSDSQERIQIKAAGILHDNSEKLILSEGEFVFPNSVYLKWNRDLASSAKDSIFEALLECMLSKKKDYWKSYSLNQFLYCLYKIMGDTEYKRTSMASALCAKELIEVISDGSLSSGFCPPDQDNIRYSQIQELADQIVPDLDSCVAKITQSDYNLSVKISEWEEEDWFKTLTNEELKRYEI